MMGINISILLCSNTAQSVAAMQHLESRWCEHPHTHTLPHTDHTHSQPQHFTNIFETHKLHSNCETSISLQRKVFFRRTMKPLYIFPETWRHLCFIFRRLSLSNRPSPQGSCSPFAQIVFVSKQQTR